MITWRHNKNPGTITYGGGDYGSFMALVAKHPLSIRLAQLKIEHGSVYKYDVAVPAATQSPHWPDTLARATIELESFAAVAALPPTDARLPTEDGQPDFAFADAEAAAVAVKHGESRLYASLQWRHGYIDRGNPRVPSNAAVNNVARVHLTRTPSPSRSSGGGKSIDRIMNVRMQNQTAADAQGWSRLYATPTIGDYTIAMNLHSDPLVWMPPASLVGEPAVDLISGNRLSSVTASITIASKATLVLFSGSTGTVRGEHSHHHAHAGISDALSGGKGDARATAAPHSCGPSCTPTQLQFPPMSGIICEIRAASAGLNGCCPDCTRQLCADNGTQWPLCSSVQGGLVCPGNTGGC